MSSFLKRFLVVLIASAFIAGIFLSERMLGVKAGNYLLFFLVPFIFGLMIISAVFEKNAGVLAFFLVATALFVYLAIVDNAAIARVRDTILILSAVGFGAGALVYFLQIMDQRG